MCVLKIFGENTKNGVDSGRTVAVWRCKTKTAALVGQPFLSVMELCLKLGGEVKLNVWEVVLHHL